MYTNRYINHQKVLIAVDCIIFGFDGDNIKALLIKRGFAPEKGKWSLMGGFVGKKENPDEAAARVLHRLTGMKNVYMEQLGTFSKVDRDPVERVISIAYFALINIADYSGQLQHDHEAKWSPLSEIPPLIFDHTEMVEKAKEHLKQKGATHPIGFNLLPKKFTLQQLQILYEAIYETTWDKGNFSRKMLSLAILNKLDEKAKGACKKRAFLYMFDTVKFSRLQSYGLKFI